MNIQETEYGSYYSRYITLSNGVDLMDQLNAQKSEMLSLMKSLTEEEALYAYESGKWTFKEVFGHIIDTERIMNYRALAIARGESKPLPGYDQDVYVKHSRFNAFSQEELMDQYNAVREATIQFFSSLNDEELMRKGVVNEISFTVRALGYVIAGHEHHHLNFFTERYLPGIS
jgi:hypothetical protein